MSLLAPLRSWLRVSTQRADFEREMQDEMREHLELYQAELRRQGATCRPARRAASTRSALCERGESQQLRQPQPSGCRRKPPILTSATARSAAPSAG